MMKKLLYLLFPLLFAAACTTGPTAPPEPPPGTLFVNPGISRGPISPLVYGTNHGPWIGLPLERFPDAERAGLTMIRYPAGEWGDRNNIKPYHIDLIVSIAEMMDAELSINARLMNGTPEMAAELVRMVNIEKELGVRYWGIGNEPKYFETVLGEPYDIERFNREWRAIAEAMKEVDPTILLIGPEVDGFNADEASNQKDSAGRDWMIEFLKANGDLVDVVSFHYYPFPTSQAGPNATVEDLRQNAITWGDTVVYLRGLIEEHTGRDLPIAVTEVNSHYSKAIGGEGTPDSFYNAIWWGNVLGQLIRENVLIVNQFMLFSAGGDGGLGLLARGGVRPIYRVYEMYQHFGSEQVFTASDDPYISVTAAKREDGTLTIMVVNLLDVPVTKPLKIEGMGEAEAAVWLFDAAHDAEPIGVQTITGESLTFPGQSMMLFVISP